MDEKEEAVKFQLINVRLSLDSLKGILSGYIHHYRDRIPDIFDLIGKTSPYLSFDIIEIQPPSHQLVRFWLHWGSINEKDGSASERSGEISFVSLGDGQANIFGEFFPKNEREEKFVQEMWGHIEQSITLIKETVLNSASEFPLKLVKPSRRKYSDQRMVEALTKWGALDKSKNPITLEEFLCEEFGTDPEGNPLVPRTTFYGWKASLRRKGLYE